MKKMKKMKMKGKENAYRDLTPMASHLGMNMGAQKKFVKGDLKDGAQAGDVRPLSPYCANMG